MSPSLDIRVDYYGRTKAEALLRFRIEHPESVLFDIRNDRVTGAYAVVANTKRGLCAFLRSHYREVAR